MAEGWNRAQTNDASSDRGQLRGLPQVARTTTTSIGLSAHGSARSPVVEFGSILAANAANHAGFAGFADS
jgi:hypothetical protein